MTLSTTDSLLKSNCPTKIKDIQTAYSLFLKKDRVNVESYFPSSTLLTCPKVYER